MIGEPESHDRGIGVLVAALGTAQRIVNDSRYKAFLRKMNLPE